jgi:hypothetical protein
MRQFCRLRVAPRDQVLGAGDEVVEDVLLARELAGTMPVVAELAAAAQVGAHVDAAVAQPGHRGAVEVGAQRDAVAAVGRQQHRLLAVQPLALAAHDGHRHARAVLRDRELAHRFVAGQPAAHGKRRWVAELRGLWLGAGFRAVVGVPAEGRGVALAAEQDPVAAEPGAERGGGHRLRADRTQRLAGQRVRAQLRRAAHQQLQVQPRGGGAQRLDYRVALGHDGRGADEVGAGVGQVHRDDAPARRTLQHQRVEPAVGAEGRAAHAVGIGGDAPPRAVAAAQVEAVLAAVAIADGGQQVLAVLAGRQRGLGDAREVAADHVAVLRRRRAQLVEPDLLVEVGVGRRALIALRVARVVEALAVRRPRDAAAAGGVLHTRHAVGQQFAGVAAHDVQRAVLAAVLRQRHGHQPAVGRGAVPVDGGLAAAVQPHRVEQHLLARRVGAVHHHQQGLRLRRLALQREQRRTVAAATGSAALLALAAAGPHRPLPAAPRPRTRWSWRWPSTTSSRWTRPRPSRSRPARSWAMPTTACCATTWPTPAS